MTETIGQNESNAVNLWYKQHNNCYMFFQRDLLQTYNARLEDPPPLVDIGRETTAC
jgi:hypothetical protein